MSISASTRAILDKIQDLSGLPVVVQPDPALKTLAVVRMARGTAPMHVVLFNPSQGVSPDFLICYQSGFILRELSVPKQERVDFTGTKHGRNEVEKLLRGHLDNRIRSAIKDTGISNLRDQMFEGILLQLRSVPIGLRVDAWLINDYPELKQAQFAAARLQLEQNVLALKPEIRQMTPPIIYQSNAAMNAVYAEYWAGKLGDMLLTLPYKTTNFQKRGQNLLSLSDEIGDDPIQDRKVIDTWAADLKLDGWYEWVPRQHA